jgi:hypothetical protein
MSSTKAKEMNMHYSTQAAAAYDAGFYDAARMMQKGLKAIGAQWDESLFLAWAEKHDVRKEQDFSNLRLDLETVAGLAMIKRRYELVAELFAAMCSEAATER